MILTERIHCDENDDFELFLTNPIVLEEHDSSKLPIGKVLHLFSSINKAEIKLNDDFELPENYKFEVGKAAGKVIEVSLIKA